MSVLEDSPRERALTTPSLGTAQVYALVYVGDCIREAAAVDHTDALQSIALNLGDVAREIEGLAREVAAK